MELLEQIKQRAKEYNKTIALPEGEEERTLKAADIILKEQLAKLILIGNPQTIAGKAKQYGLENIDKAQIIDPQNYPDAGKLADIMVELRKHKGMTMEKALEQLKNPYYLATLLIKAGQADGMVGGAIAPTADTIRPALQYIKTKPGISIVSGAFVMIVRIKTTVTTALWSLPTVPLILIPRLSNWLK